MAYSHTNICTKNYWNWMIIAIIIDGGWWYHFFETQCIYITFNSNKGPKASLAMYMLHYAGTMYVH